MTLAYPYDDLTKQSAAAGSIHVRRGTARVLTGYGTYTPFAPGLDQFSEFEMYDIDDWDGYGAKPITRETVVTARRFRRLLPRYAGTPDIAPGADGTIGFEWRSGPDTDRTILIVDVGPGDTIKAVRIRAGRTVESWPSKPLESSVFAFMSALFRSNEPA
jgi:hypothetical protein